MGRPLIDRVKEGTIVRCTLCMLNKKPWGRSAPLEWYGCDTDCDGYFDAPLPQDLWPGESRREAFGGEWGKVAG